MVRSAPAQNVSLPEVMTAPLIGGVGRDLFDDRRQVLQSPCRRCTFIERPGMSQVTSAMPSASVSRVKLVKRHRVSVVLDLGLPARATSRGIRLADLVRVREHSRRRV